MAISIQKIHTDIRSQLRKHSAGFVSPEDIDIAVNKASIDILAEVVKEYRANTLDNTTEHELLYKVALTSGPVYTLPTDIFSIVAIFDGEFEGDILNAYDFNNRKNSTILAPTSLSCIATIYNLSGTPKIEVAPTSSSNSIKYWKTPATVVFNYTQSNGTITFSSSGSVNLDFPMSLYSKVINRTLVYLTPSAKNAEAAQIETQLR